MKHNNQLFGIMLVCVCLTTSAFAVYGVGDTVNNFTLQDAQGNTVSLYDYSGMGILLHFWGDC
ncbi:redoxin domain-containing protein [bacterium]|nr:redoxin domain-containing protein [bacterium]